MSRKQLFALLVVNLAAFGSSIGLFTLLPVYATRLGADPAATGAFLSSIFVAVALGTIIGGWLSDRFQKRKLTLLVAGVLIVPLTLLMAAATTLTQLTLLTAATWFLVSIVTAIVGILAGLFAGEYERGRVFGLLGLGVGIGGAIGSFAAGPVVDRWGYQALFQAAAVGYTVVPLAGLFLADRVIPRSQTTQVTATRSGLLTSRTFLLLACASIIVHVANSQIGLAKPLIMDGLQYDATAISTAGAIGTLVTIPVPLLVGWLSDRLGRKPFIVLIYITQVVGLLVLISGSLLWQFWIISSLQSMVGNSIVAGQALITDQFPKEVLGTALSLFGATPWIGFVIGFGLSGTAMNALGMAPSLMLGVGLVVVAMLLLIPVQRRVPQPRVVG
jgi:MFS family permease